MGEFIDEIIRTVKNKEEQVEEEKTEEIQEVQAPETGIYIDETNDNAAPEISETAASEPCLESNVIFCGSADEIIEPKDKPAPGVIIKQLAKNENSKQSAKNPAATLRTPDEPSARKKHAIDAQLEAMIAQARARIKIIGCGGAGNNTITRMSEIKITGTTTIAINTDAQDLLYAAADEKVLIGKDLTHGLGAGSNPKVGEESARENEHELREVLSNADMVFVTCGMGGGTGTGSAPVIAEIAKKSGALTIGVVTLPFTMEGKRRTENAIAGLEKLEKNVDTLIIIPNDRLLDLAPELPLHTAFKVADEILSNAVKGIVELVTKPGLVNLDFSDVKTVMHNGGMALIGIGESESNNRPVDAVERAISNPLIDVDITGASGALINIVGGSDLTLEDSRKIIENVAKRLDHNAKIIWGAQIDPALKKTIRVLIIITGVRSSEVWAAGKKAAEKRKREMETHLGIPFVDND